MLKKTLILKNHWFCFKDCKNDSANDQNNLVWMGAYKNDALVLYFFKTNDKKKKKITRNVSYVNLIT